LHQSYQFKIDLLSKLPTSSRSQAILMKKVTMSPWRCGLCMCICTKWHRLRLRILKMGDYLCMYLYTYTCVDQKTILLYKETRSGLPDGLFSNQNSKFGKILEGLAVEDVGIFYGHLVHFTVFWYILLTFGIVCGNLVYFSRFGILYQEKSGNPGRDV
jgi:hypothetical protein